MPRRRRHRGLGELGRLTKVVEVKECPKSPGVCCAKLRGSGNAEKGDFERLCSAHKPPLKVRVGDTEKKTSKSSELPAHESATVPTEGLSMARRRYRRHAALAEYGEPMGDIGFIGDLLNKQDLKEFGLVALGGLGSAAVTPKVIKLLDKLSFIPVNARGYVKGFAAVLGGFATYKYLGRRVPARYRDAIVAASGVMAGLGVSQIGHELFDKGAVGAKLKDLAGLEDISAIFPAAFSDVGDELEMLAALNAVEDRALSDGGEQFGDVFQTDGLNEMTEAWNGFDADVDAQDSWAVAGGAEQGMLGPQFPAGGPLDGFDASVEAEDAWAYEEDLDQMQMVAAQ